MLKAIPRSWFTWSFDLFLGAEPVAEVDLSWWREKGSLTVAGRSYDVYREGWMSGAFLLVSDGRPLARAEKPSAFLRSFDVEHDGRRYTLRARSPFGREMVLFAGSEEVGSIAPESFLTRRATANLPETLPLPVRVFLVWLSLLLWKRAADSAAAST